ncbi:MAG: TatD family hydrolase [bacterium]|nr:TatD family hydrolase [bacterium]
MKIRKRAGITFILCFCLIFSMILSGCDAQTVTQVEDALAAAEEATENAGAIADGTEQLAEEIKQAAAEAEKRASDAKAAERIAAEAQKALEAAEEAALAAEAEVAQLEKAAEATMSETSQGDKTAAYESAKIETGKTETSKTETGKTETGNTEPDKTEAGKADTSKKNDSTYRFVDSHLHYLDFTQKTDGFEKLVEKMDEANVDSAVIFGMGMSKKWDASAPEAPKYYLSNDSAAYYFTGTDYIMLEQLSQASEEIQDRFYPFICGVNPTDLYAADYLEQLLELYPNQIKGIGEVMSHHDDLTALTGGETPRADHPAMLKIYDLAAEYDLPVLIHHNIAGSYMDEPIYLEEMKNALKYNRDVNIIWAHAGISRRVELSNLTEITDQMLKDNPNLYYDISWVVYDDYIAKDDASLDEWAALIEKYPDRFMIGSDKVGHWDTYPEEITKYYPLLERLSTETATKLCSDNILVLIHEKEAETEEIT